MTTIVNAPSLDDRLAARIAAERSRRAWTVAELGERSGVSPAMISKVERGAARPTASLLGKLSAAFSLPLSQLFASIEEAPSRLARARDQAVWTDPRSHYRRRAVSPPGDARLQLTRVELPARARVSYPAAAYAFIHQQVWVLEGMLTLREGKAVHQLRPGDCLELGPPADCRFENATAKRCCYLVAVVPH